jgi:hypothetical protein
MAKSNTARTKTALLAVIEDPTSTVDEKLKAAALFSRKPRKRKPKMAEAGNSDALAATAAKGSGRCFDEIMGGYGDYLTALTVAEADREWEELERDIAAGNPEAIAAKAAFDALKNMAFKWEGPDAPRSPERHRAIEAYEATWHKWWWFAARPCPGPRERSCRGPSSFIARQRGANIASRSKELAQVLQEYRLERILV